MKKSDGKKQMINLDSGKEVDTYLQHGWYWYPHVRLMNHDGKDFQWWPNTDEARKSFGPGTYGPDVELDFIFKFMERQVADDRPFLVYHTSLEAILKQTRTTAPLQLKQKQWYKLGVRIIADRMSVTLNGKEVARLRSAGFQHPTNAPTSCFF